MGAHAYADQVARVLNSFEFFEERPVRPTKIQIPDIPNPPFGWKEKFPLRDGKVLTVTDNITFDSEGKPVDRAFGYDFRNKGSDQPIFRVCNHTTKQPADAPCHVHVDSEDNIIECFPTSVGKDFSYAVHCIKNFYLNKPQDWEKGDNDESDSESATL